MTYKVFSALYLRKNSILNQSVTNAEDKSSLENRNKLGLMLDLVYALLFVVFCC